MTTEPKSTELIAEGLLRRVQEAASRTRTGSTSISIECRDLIPVLEEVGPLITHARTLASADRAYLAAVEIMDGGDVSEDAQRYVQDTYHASLAALETYREWISERYPS